MTPMKKMILLVAIVLPLFSIAQNKTKNTNTGSQPTFNYAVINPDNELSQKEGFKESYNTGMALYNRGVKMMHKGDQLNQEQHAQQLNDIKNRYIDLFKKALPEFEKAYELNPKHSQTLTALTGIYLALDEKEKYKKVKKELESIQKK